jgi:hypothetical protein
MKNTILAITHFLNIKLPYKIILRENKYKGGMAWHTALVRKGKLIGHKIEVTLDTTKDLRDTDTLIIHEFIHAWQAENGYTDIHGKSFRRMARKVEKVFEIPNIYLKKYDL